MGVLTEILIADITEAENIASSSGPVEHWKGIDASGHNDLTLGSLFCILQGRSYDSEKLDRFSLLAEESVKGPWVFEFPNEFIRSLTQISDADLPEIISKWIETREFGNAQFDEMKNFIKDLRDLAEESVVWRKSLLMWICL